MKGLQCLQFGKTTHQCFPRGRQGRETSFIRASQKDAKLASFTVRKVSKLVNELANENNRALNEPSIDLNL